jgi:hypothetical protein
MLIVGVFLAVGWAFSQSTPATAPTSQATAPVAAPVPAPAAMLPAAMVAVKAPAVVVKKEAPAEKEERPKKKPCTKRDLVFKTNFDDEEEELMEKEDEITDVRTVGAKKKRIHTKEEPNPNLWSSVGTWRTIRDGLQVWNVLSDGACFFRAAVLAMFIHNNPGKNFEENEDAQSLQLRLDTVDYIRKNPNMCEDMDVADKHRKAMTMDEYCTNMSNPFECADDAVISAFCVQKKIQIILYKRVKKDNIFTTQIAFVIGESNTGGTIKLYYTGKHYMVVSGN